VNERKTETVNLRMAPGTKELLRLAAAKEHRTLSNMVDALILDHCERNGIALEAQPSKEPLADARTRPT
jgi:uncharacterized protein (DUF1778 family)